jgi:hypothetical protein
MRSLMLSCVLVLLLTTAGVGLCQGVPGCYPPTCPTVQRCCPTPPPAPIIRRVQVEVPVPCPPMTCTPPCGLPTRQGAITCPQPQIGPRPVHVRVEVVVRPEGPQPCPQPKIECGNPPVFEPYFCAVAGVLRSAVLAPLCIGERIMGHAPTMVRRMPMRCSYAPICPAAPYCGPHPAARCVKVGPRPCPPRNYGAHRSGVPLAYSEGLTGGINR